MVSATKLKNKNKTNKQTNKSGGDAINGHRMLALLRQKSLGKNGVECTFQAKNLEHMDPLSRLN